MAKRPDLSSAQKKIVNRYYEHRDTIKLTTLQELVTELYLATGDKASAKLWKRVETHLQGVAANNAEARKVLESRDVEGLARLIQALSR